MLESSEKTKQMPFWQTTLAILSGTPTPHHRKRSQTLLLHIAPCLLNLKKQTTSVNLPLLLASYLACLHWWHHWLLPPSLLQCSGGKLSSSGEKGGWLVVQRGLNGDLELPPVADAQTWICPFELCLWTAGGMEAAHTERRLCSCRLMQWLIDPKPLYSFTTGVWNTTLYLRGHVCYIPLSLYQSFSLSSFLGLALPPVQSFCISDSSSS